MSITANPSSPRSLAIIDLLTSTKMRDRFVMLSVWLVPLMMLTMPGNNAPSQARFLDPLAMIKLIVLALVFVGSAVMIAVCHKQASIRHAIRQHFGLAMFFAWGLLTIFWSPAKHVSLGQWGMTTAMLLFGTIVASLCSSPRFVSRLLRNLSYALLAFNLFMLAIYAVAPDLSGLNRSMLHVGGDGIIHPTAAASTASLALLIIVMCKKIGQFPWANRLMIPCVVTHVLMLLLCQSRTALVMAAITIGGVYFCFGSNRLRAYSSILFAIIAAAFLILDPSLGSVLDSGGATAEYLSRGQSVDELRAASGRSEMWAKVWTHTKAAIVLGNGFHVTSPTGEFLAWNLIANHDAHNVFLQAWATTGVVGLALFVFGLLSLAKSMIRLANMGLFAQHMLWMLFFLTVWYAGWSIGCISILGAMRVECMVFAIFVGIGVGQQIPTQSGAKQPARVTTSYA